MHLIIILAIALIIFGPGKLPELGKGLGKSIREFKKAMSGGEERPATEVRKEITSPGGSELKKESISHDTSERKR